MSTISILVRHFNKTAHLDACLTSVFIQEKLLDQAKITHKVEVVLVDDGSAKNEQAKLKKIINKFPNIKYKALNHVGPIKALNYALRECTGDWFTVLDCDDTLPNDSLSTLWDPNYDFIYGNYLELSSDAASKKEFDTKDNIFNTLAGGILFKKRAVLEVGGYDESLFFPEYDLLLKIGPHKGKHVQKIVYHYNRSAISLTSLKEQVLKGRQQLDKKYKRKIPIRDYDL